MSESNSMVIFTKASQMLAEANTIQKAKELKSLALTAADWAKRKGMGEEAVQYARAYALDAERKMGELLIQTPLNKGTVLAGKEKFGGTRIVPPKENIPRLADLGISKNESSKAQKLARLSEEKFEEIKSGELKLHNALKPHVSENSGENEWYTPSKYIEAARATMGDIDLDPASSDFANKTVKAGCYYTIRDDGLSKKWYGRIWLNPPYSQPEIQHFINALKENIKDIEQGCVLVNNATDTMWMQNLMSISSAICFPKGRIKFVDINGNETGAPLQGQAIIYIGNNVLNFISHFSKFGIIWIASAVK